MATKPNTNKPAPKGSWSLFGASPAYDGPRNPPKGGSALPPDPPRQATVKRK
ncbi:hypothetical protein [Phenylobacterium sp.]|jgi:hypothetical protein|uniref:hypothetical protein n=1 Tax=Phenylobacterium sp. TaxID=1871053 RepID=UPI002F3FE178